MFDIGFSEILLVAVVALVVIGPERLPGVARNVGCYAGRLQRYVQDVKRDFNREVEFEEIKRLQHEMETTVQSMQESMRAVETILQQETQKHQAELTTALSADEKPALVKKSKPVLAQAPTATEPTADPKP
ncbi:MAG: Twin-arginine translocation protein TatB [Fluviibacter phosphoraccumulans EoVTN8]